MKTDRMQIGFLFRRRPPPASPPCPGCCGRPNQRPSADTQAAPNVPLPWKCHFCACKARGRNSPRLAKSSPYASPSAGAEVASLRQWHVWCLLGKVQVRLHPELVIEREQCCGAKRFAPTRPTTQSTCASPPPRWRTNRFVLLRTSLPFCRMSKVQYAGPEDVACGSNYRKLVRRPGG